jgi:hypothetical protein
MATMKAEWQKKQPANAQHILVNSMLQRAALNETPVREVPQVVHEVLHSPGQPLDAQTRSFFEPRFGHDFSQVRIHLNAKAAESARAVDALAYTFGRDIVFDTGQYTPGKSSGQRLLAHELTHVVQQETAGNNDLLKSPVLLRQVSFGSSGPGVIDEAGPQSVPIERYRQTEVLHIENPANPTYGTECLAVSIMYMLQSYGLVPPNMSRQEFESAFTSLTPPAYGSPPADKIKVAGIEQVGARPVDLFSTVLEGTLHPPKIPPDPEKIKNSLSYPATRTEMTLVGANSGTFPADYVVKKLPAIFRAFDAQSKMPGYEFMRTNRPFLERFKLEAQDEWIATDDLNNNTISDEYFQKGNTLLVELSLRYPVTSVVGHRCVVVGKAKDTITDTAGQNHYLYPADDPWYKATLVMVPPYTAERVHLETTPGISVVDGKKLYYKGERVFQVAPENGHIYRRKAQKP